MGNQNHIWALDLGKSSFSFAIVNSQLPVASKPCEDGSILNSQLTSE
jgi:hypothetical protein